MFHPISKIEPNAMYYSTWHLDKFYLKFRREFLIIITFSDTCTCINDCDYVGMLVKGCQANKPIKEQNY